jgi:CO/xanthine dehydrogenase Mo-binding subunit
MSQDIAKFGLGQPVTRYEDATLTTGRGRYTGDVRTANSIVTSCDPRSAVGSLPRP